MPLKQSRQSNLVTAMTRKSTAHLAAQTERFHRVHWPCLVGEGVHALLLPANHRSSHEKARKFSRQSYGLSATVHRQVLTSTSLLRSRSRPHRKCARPRPQPLSFCFFLFLSFFLSFFFSLQRAVFSLSFLGRFEGWMLEKVQGDVLAMAASLLHWKSGLGLVDHFKTLVPGLHASSSDPVWKGMPKYKEGRSNAHCFSHFPIWCLAGFFVWDPGVAIACACAAQVLEGETPVHHQFQRRQGCRRCGDRACGQSSSRI